MTRFAPPDEIRARFSQAMSEMYRLEVPQYETLIDLVRDINDAILADDPALKTQLSAAGEIGRLGEERHGAIRVGTADELATLRRILAVMGMVPVGYYDLSVAGVPVHSTAFRPVDDAALARNPFRLFTSLLRLELIEDETLRRDAAVILGNRKIFTPGALALTARFEAEGGLHAADADAFVGEVLETFRWHRHAIVDAATYRQLNAMHRLVADVVSFKGPHINHLTPRTLDIDAAQREMTRRGLSAKAVIEGPPTRKCPILLRQTSFKALEENIIFQGIDTDTAGTHTARFGEIEQRGLALTPKGRALYDQRLAAARAESDAQSYESRLAASFELFPDDYETLRREGLGYFRYSPTDPGRPIAADIPIERLVAGGQVRADPIVYEDFLPVSAAGIFQSNLDGAEQKSFGPSDAKAAFEKALGTNVYDEFALYARAEKLSRDKVYTTSANGRSAG